MTDFLEPTQREEISLTGVLAEFRIALRQEVEAARRNESSSAIQLINGRRIAQIGGSFQFVFDIENVLNLPGDAPGELYVPNHSPLDVIVISIDGMSITLSIPIDLGAFVPEARLRSNLTFLMLKLIERIEALAMTPNPTGERVRGAMPVSGEPLPADLSNKFNAKQIEAVASSLGRDTTFIWGPPGTGKTETIGAIGDQLYKRGRSLLLVSHTNTAVDKALLKIAQALNQDELEKGRVLRVGESKDQELNKRPQLLLKTHVDRRTEELASRREKLTGERALVIDETK